MTVWHAAICVFCESYVLFQHRDTVQCIPREHRSAGTALLAYASLPFVPASLPSRAMAHLTWRSPSYAALPIRCSATRGGSPCSIVCNISLQANCTAGTGIPLQFSNPTTHQLPLGTNLDVRDMASRLLPMQHLSQGQCAALPSATSLTGDVLHAPSGPEAPARLFAVTGPHCLSAAAFVSQDPSCRRQGLPAYV